MSSNTNTKPRAQRIDSQDEATSGPPVKTDRHSVQEPGHAEGLRAAS